MGCALRRKVKVPAKGNSDLHLYKLKRKFIVETLFIHSKITNYVFINLVFAVLAFIGFPIWWRSYASLIIAHKATEEVFYAFCAKHLFSFYKNKRSPKTLHFSVYAGKE